MIPVLRQLFFLGALLSAPLLNGQQSDTVYVETTQISGELSHQQLVEVRDLAYRTHEPARLMLKIDLVKFLPNLGAEFKIGKSFSINSRLEFGTRFLGYFNKSLAAFVEPRWYMGMGRRIRSGRQANNLSGAYAGLELSYKKYEDDFIHPERTAQLFLGMQRRFLSHGLMDIGFGVGYSDLLPVQFASGGQVFRTQTRARFGLAGIFPKSPKTTQDCDVLRCFREERHMWKINLFNLLNFESYSPQPSFLVIRPSIAYEQKIGALPFSVQLTMQNSLNFTRAMVDGEKIKIQNLQMAFWLQPRWYFTQKRRIAAGRSGNNLSGLYTGVQWGYQRAFYKNSETSSLPAYSFSYGDWSFSPVLGFQQRFLRNGFVDFTLHGRWRDRSLQEFEDEGDYIISYRRNNNILYLLAQIRIGWAW
jgi:hypothetical protein